MDTNEEKKLEDESTNAEKVKHHKVLGIIGIVINIANFLDYFLTPILEYKDLSHIIWPIEFFVLIGLFCSISAVKDDSEELGTIGLIFGILVNKYITVFLLLSCFGGMIG